MANFLINNISLDAVAAAVPKPSVSNLDFPLLSEQEKAFLIKTTGIKEKRLAPESLTSSDLCFAAAKAIFDAKKAQRDEIELLVFVSQSNDYFLPATAALLQHQLKLPKTTIAFDVGLGCSGYIYGLNIVASLMQTCGLNKALLLAGDTSSTTCSVEDKSTYPLFGDAGSATLLTRSNHNESWYGNLYTDGSGADAIMITDGMSRNRPTPKSFELQDIALGIRRAPIQLALKGDEIFAFSIKEVPSSINELFKKYNRNIEDVDYFVMHQANKLMNETIRKKLKIEPEKTPYSLDEFGNTSSASIPLTLVTRLSERLKKPSNLLLSGFGVGLSWGNLFTENTEIHCLPLIEVDI